MKIKFLIANILFSSKFSNFIPGYIRKKIIKNNNICFVPTKLNKLPSNNHPIFTSLEHQKNIIKKFSDNQEEITFKTYSKLVKLLTDKYKKEEKFNFLDFGGEQIDQYLILKKKFPNINYYIMNQKKINGFFNEIKNIYNYQNLFVINNFEELVSYKYDFVNFGSVLQYVDNYKELLDKILSNSNEYVLISGTHLYKKMINNENQVVKQVNLHPKKMYLFFFYFYSFIKIFENHRFKIEFISKNETHNINYKNFELIGLKELEYTDILLKKY